MILDGPDTPIDRRLSQLGFRAAVSLSQASVRWWWPGMPLIVAPDLMRSSSVLRDVQPTVGLLCAVLKAARSR